MAKVIAHVNKNTEHKDRLILVSLVAILAFTVVNTVLTFAQISLNESALHVLY